MRELLLDSNLLLLFIVGQTGESSVESHRRLDSFDYEDFLLLESICAGYSGFVSLPNILTEVSNLLGIGRMDNPLILDRYKRYAALARELYRPTKGVVETPFFPALGLTDSVIVSLRGEQISVLTVDHDLFGVLNHLGVEAINLRHMKTPQ